MGSCGLQGAAMPWSLVRKRNYSVGSPFNGVGATLDSSPTTTDIYNGPYFGTDEDGIANDCRYWNANGQARTDTLQDHNESYPTVTQAVVKLSCSGINPLEIFTTDRIVWNMFVTVC